MRATCETCHGTGLTAYGRAVQEGRARRRDYRDVALFCHRCDGRGNLRNWRDTLADLVIAVLIVTGCVGFWGAVLYVVVIR